MCLVESNSDSSDDAAEIVGDSGGIGDDGGVGWITGSSKLWNLTVSLMFWIQTWFDEYGVDKHEHSWIWGKIQ